MGEQRTSEVTMFALLFFLLLGVIILLAAAGRIWIDAPPPSGTVDSATANNPGDPVSLRHISGSKDSVA